MLFFVGATTTTTTRTACSPIRGPIAAIGAHLIRQQRLGSAIRYQSQHRTVATRGCHRIRQLLSTSAATAVFKPSTGIGRRSISMTSLVTSSVTSPVTSQAQTQAQTPASSTSTATSTNSSSLPIMSGSVSTSAMLPSSTIPIFTTVREYRDWRKKAFRSDLTVGFVPTMGALHEGHLALVKKSLAENDLTVLSIFVNPAQFAPHEDLETYPRTLERDLGALEALSMTLTRGTGTGGEKVVTRTPSAVFCPTVKEMYPSGINQDVSVQKGTFVEVKGYGHQMEGKSRPTFFRGVATVVTKLFNIIQPTNAYFGQKDIQQALLLKRLSRDLILPNPEPQNLHIVPTARDPIDNLALSSRNAYLTSEGRTVAGTLYSALEAARSGWVSGFTKKECIQRAIEVVESAKVDAIRSGLSVEMRLDYIEMNDSDTFEILEDGVYRKDSDVGESLQVMLSGALWVDKTRLIDNVLLGDIDKIVG